MAAGTVDVVRQAHGETPGPAVPSRHWRGALTGLLAVASVLAAWQTHRLVAAQREARFDYEVRQIDSAVRERMDAYVQVLRGARGLFGVVGEAREVRREDWIRYVDALNLSARYPGFKALSFAAAVRPEDVDAFVAKIRRDPLPPALQNPALLRQFHLRAPTGWESAPLPPLFAPIVFVAPLVPANERVLGVDMMREPSRRDAMERAARSGQAVLSPRLQLSGQGDQKAGFIAYLAVDDAAAGRPLGWLTAAFLADDFMHGLLGTGAPSLEFEVFDGESADPAALLYSTAGIEADGRPRPLPGERAAVIERQVQLDLPGRRWTLRHRAGESFVPLADRIAPWLVLVGGLLVTLLFHVTARSGARLRAALMRVEEQNRELAREMRERTRAEAEARYQATHDALTGLANRSLFVTRLRAALEDAAQGRSSLALVYVDIDGFKAVNDTHGHHVGDELLKAIAGRLRARVRPSDIPARLGGDEFAVLVPDIDDALAVCRRLCSDIVEALRAPYQVQDGETAVAVQVGASVGVALHPQHGTDIDTLIVTADRAMYAAKRGGKNRYVIAAS